MMAYPMDLSVTARYLMAQIQKGTGGCPDCNAPEIVNVAYFISAIFLQFPG